MHSFVRSVLASASGFLLVIILVVAVAAWRLDTQTDIEKHSWLHLDLYGDLPEYNPPAGLSGVLGGGAQTLQSILTSLDMAIVDDRIDGVVLQLSASQGAGGAKLEEIRNAVLRVRESGKPVLAYADNIDLKVIFTAAACDSFFCPPPAYVQCMGLDRAIPHVKEALDKLGVAPQLSVLKEYKSAAQVITRTDLTPEARANAEMILNDFMAMYGEAIETGRGGQPAPLASWMQKALFTSREAQETGIVDRVLYWDELESRFIPSGKELPRIVSGARYAEEDPADLDLGGDQKIAVIHAQGNIGGRKNTVNPVLGLMMGHETINREIERALRDDDVVAIILRVDSGGGESLASDLMGHKVEMASRQKPVIVSMVDVAASGGYMMSYRASHIMADEMTITGSIGSISGKFDMSGFNKKIGLGHSHVSAGANARFMSDDEPFTATEFALYEANHMADFQNWLEGVARAREMEVAEVEELAMGRVFTGRQALANGLIDEVGGLHEAVAAARRLADIETDKELGLWHLPVQQGLVETVLGGPEEELSAAGRWLLYTNIKQDLEMVRHSLVSENWQTINPIFTD